MNEPKPPFTLTKEEKLSPLWRALVAHWEDRLEVLRTQNEANRSEVETALLRGRIAECRLNLQLGKEEFKN